MLEKGFAFTVQDRLSQRVCVRAEECVGAGLYLVIGVMSLTDPLALVVCRSLWGVGESHSGRQ